jgi:DnaJ-class molecular chaperone
VDRDATPEEIKNAYRRKAQSSHPDREGGDADVFHTMVAAYEILSDPERRDRYDRTGYTGKDDPVETKVRQLFDAIISQDAFDGDIISQGRDRCRAALAEIDAKTKAHNTRVMKLTKNLDRVKSRHTNIYREIMEQRIEVLQGIIDHDAKERDLIEKVMEHLTDYTDEAPPTVTTVRFYT